MRTAREGEECLFLTGNYTYFNVSVSRYTPDLWSEAGAGYLLLKSPPNNTLAGGAGVLQVDLGRGVLPVQTVTSPRSLAHAFLVYIVIPTSERWAGYLDTLFQAVMGLARLPPVCTSRENGDVILSPVVIVRQVCVTLICSSCPLKTLCCSREMFRSPNEVSFH